MKFIVFKAAYNTISRNSLKKIGHINEIGDLDRYDFTTLEKTCSSKGRIDTRFRRI